MKFLVLVGILVGFLSAATNLTEEELKFLKQKEASAAVVESIGTGAGGAGGPVHPIHEILSKLTAGLGQAVAQDENLDPKDPLKHLMSLDYMKAHGDGVLAEVDANLKKALGDSESFKNFLGAANSNDENGPFNVGKMFPPKVLSDILNGKNEALMKMHTPPSIMNSPKFLVLKRKKLPISVLGFITSSLKFPRTVI